MGLVRTKQLNLPELYEVLDPRYTKAGTLIELTVTTDWVLDGNYYVQTISDIEGITAESKLVVQVKKSVDDTYEQTLEKENLFAHIIKIVSTNGAITIYSSKALETSFDIQVLYFG